MTTSHWRVGAVALLAWAGSFALSSCSDGGVSSQTSKNEATVSDVGTVRAALSIDGCTDTKRNECAAGLCGCTNGSCQGGACLPQFDGCAQLQRDNAAVFGCGCLNGNPSGGPCPALSDGCTDSQRQFFGHFGCGCKNGQPFGDICATPPEDSPAMPIPPVLSPTSSNQTTDFYNLTVMPGTARIRSGALSAIVGYNGTYPGPTIVATKGRKVQLTVTNSWSGEASLGEHDISVHNHGHKVAPTSDGHPIDYIHVGGSKPYTYPNDQRASTYWYHDHTMDRTASRVFNGLAGFYIIKDSTEDSLNLPSGMYDVPLMIQDKTMSTANVLDTAGIVLVGAVNGVSGAHFNVDKHKYRFRILNGSSERVMNLAFTARTFTVIGTDGGLLEHPVRNVSSLSIAPAERYDIVVDFSTSNLASTDFLKDTTTNGLRNLLEFRINRDPGPDNSAVPDNLSTFQRFTDAEILQAFARSFPNTPIDTNPTYLTFGIDGTGWMLSNHGIYNPQRVDITSKLNTPYVWMLDNTRTGQPHPFHKHLSQFLIGGMFDANGNSLPLDPVLKGWKDTINVPPGRKMLIVFKNETFTTDTQCSQQPVQVGTNRCLPYVFHCHNLGHEDNRMMLQETVVP